MSAVRDELGRVLCCHGRPIQCNECGEDYEAELVAASRPRPQEGQHWAKCEPDTGWHIWTADGVNACQCGSRLLRYSSSAAASPPPQEPGLLALVRSLRRIAQGTRLSSFDVPILEDAADVLERAGRSRPPADPESAK